MTGKLSRREAHLAYLLAVLDCLRGFHKDASDSEAWLTEEQVSTLSTGGVWYLHPACKVTEFLKTMVSRGFTSYQVTKMACDTLFALVDKRPETLNGVFDMLFRRGFEHDQIVKLFRTSLIHLARDSAPAFLDMLLDHFKFDRAQVVKLSCAAFHKLGLDKAPAFLDMLLELFKSDHDQVAKLSYAALYKLGVVNARAFLDMLLGLFESDRDQVVRVSCAALYKLGLDNARAFLDMLLGLFKSDHDQVVKLSCGSLFALGLDNARAFLGMLLGLFKSDRGQVVTVSCDSLFALGLDNARAFLGMLLELFESDRGQVAKLSCGSLFALGLDNARAFLGMLLGLFKSDRGQVVKLSCGSLFALGLDNARAFLGMLLDLFKSDRGQVVTVSCDSLFALGLDNARAFLGMLLELFESDRGQVAKLSCGSLFALGLDNARAFLGMLLDLFKSDRGQVVKLSCGSLFALGLDNARAFLGMLLDLFKSDRGQVVTVSCNSLFALGLDNARAFLDMLLGLFESDRRQVVTVSCDSLFALGLDNARAFLDMLLGLFESDRRQVVTVSCDSLFALGLDKAQPFLDMLLELFKSDRGQVVTVSCNSLFALGLDNARAFLGMLLDLFKSDRGQVVTVSCNSLFALGLDNARAFLDMLLELFESDRRQVVTVSCGSLFALGLDNTRAFLDMLLGLFKSDRGQVAKLSCDSLFALGQGKAEAILRRALVSLQPEIVAAACQCSFWAGGPSRLDQVLGALELVSPERLKKMLNGNIRSDAFNARGRNSLGLLSFMLSNFGGLKVKDDPVSDSGTEKMGGDEPVILKVTIGGFFRRGPQAVKDFLGLYSLMLLHLALPNIHLTAKQALGFVMKTSVWLKDDKHRAKFSMIAEALSIACRIAGGGHFFDPPKDGENSKLSSVVRLLRVCRKDPHRLVQIWCSGPSFSEPSVDAQLEVLAMAKEKLSKDPILGGDELNKAAVLAVKQAFSHRTLTCKGPHKNFISLFKLLLEIFSPTEASSILSYHCAGVVLKHAEIIQDSEIPKRLFEALRDMGGAQLALPLMRSPAFLELAVHFFTSNDSDALFRPLRRACRVLGPRKELTDLFAPGPDAKPPSAVLVKKQFLVAENYTKPEVIKSILEEIVAAGLDRKKWKADKSATLLALEKPPPS